MPSLRFALRLICVLALSGTLQAAEPVLCGGPDMACPVTDGQYWIIPAPGPKTGKALIYLHGYNGSAAGILHNSAFIKKLHARGYALIAPQGLRGPGAKAKRDWSVVDGSVHIRDDIVYLEAVLADAHARFGIERAHTVLAGFSRGASMVWNVACYHPELVRAYIPVAGALWEPLPSACAGPADLFHIHGWTDRTVPLEGRPIENGRLIQGDTFTSLILLRRANGCPEGRPTSATMEQDHTLWLRHWENCTKARLDLMLHPGAHSLPQGWLEHSLDWFEALPPRG